MRGIQFNRNTVQDKATYSICAESAISLLLKALINTWFWSCITDLCDSTSFKPTIRTLTENGAFQQAKWTLPCFCTTKIPRWHTKNSQRYGESCRVQCFFTCHHQKIAKWHKMSDQWGHMRWNLETFLWHCHRGVDYHMPPCQWHVERILGIFG